MVDAAPAIGTVLDGRYRIERVLGRGGMGAVYAARQLQIDEPVALKLLHASLARDPELVARFQREAKAARKIQSEHAVKILDVGLLANGTPYLVMEHLEGMDLERVVEQGRLPVHVAVDYVLQAMEALAEAHMQGVVHRDLKPANLFLTKRPDGTSLVKVLDFGISKLAASDGDLSLTKTGAGPMGSPLYMAPEQMRTSRGTDARTDIWALGIILYELLSGTMPFNGQTATEVCAAVLQDPVPSLHALHADIPTGIDTIVGRCLAKDPAARYQDVGALAFELGAFAPHRTSVERIAGVFRESTATAPTAMAPPIVLTPRPSREPAPLPVTVGPWTPPVGTVALLPVTPQKQPAKRGVGVAVGVGVALIAAFGLGATWFVKRRLAQRTAPNEPPVDVPVTTFTMPTASIAGAVPVFKTAPISFRPMPGAYAGPIDVAMKTRTGGAFIHYSTDGAEPTEKSALYLKPVHLAAGGTLKARAFGAGRAPSEIMAQMYSPPVITPGFDLRTPVSADVANAPCQRAGRPTEIMIRNPLGPATSFTASLRKGDASPFSLGVQGPIAVAAGDSAPVVVTAKPFAAEPASLTDVTDLLEITVGTLPPRSISLHAQAAGGVLEVGVREVDFGDVPIGIPSPRLLYVQNTGSVPLSVGLSSSDETKFTLPTRIIGIQPDTYNMFSVIYTGKAGPANGTLFLTTNISEPYCDKPPAPIELRANGVK